MTTYAHRITLTDDEVTTLQAALEHYRKICAAELTDGAKCPYWAHAHSIDAVLPRLRADAVMTSASSSSEDAG